MLIFEPVSNKKTIANRDENLTEFEVQSFLYGEIKAKGLNVRGELVHIDKKTKEKCRFDLVLFDKSGIKAELIIEVKAGKVKHKTTLEDTRQYKKYTEFGCKVVFVYGIEDAKELLKVI